MVEKITPVPLREVWAHEAVDFTPWLLDNLDFLNDKLPFELIEAEREKAAGTSWVDLVAKDGEGGTVVIENQFGTSDHDHLGKVITYLATYEAKRAIWIVEDARPEHIDAINWLNKMGPVDFFLVRVEAMRIGNSEPAAKFEVITGPSDSLRTAGDTKRRQASRESQSLRDVIDECKHFNTVSKKQRGKAARMTDHAIRLLWHRTGASVDAFAPRRSHAESLDFLERHPRILECVKHILTENGQEGKIARYLSPGYASGLLYLFGSSASDPSPYRDAEVPNESLLDWSRWSRACEFFALLVGGSDELKAVRTIMGKMLNDEGRAISNAERWAILVKAWNRYSTGDAVTEDDLVLEYATNEYGVRRLANCPTAGGIDLGNPPEPTEENDEEP